MMKLLIHVNIIVSCGNRFLSVTSVKGQEYINKWLTLPKQNVFSIICHCNSSPCPVTTTQDALWISWGGHWECYVMLLMFRPCPVLHVRVSQVEWPNTSCHLPFGVICWRSITIRDREKGRLFSQFACKLVMFPITPYLGDDVYVSHC